MKAILLAGGKGSRLYPYSALLPKPLMPLGDMPVLELLLRRLKIAGIDEVFIAVNHLRHLIEAFFGDGSRFGMRIRYSIEDKPLGTAGPIGLVLDQLGDNFVLANGDLLTSFDIATMIRSHLDTQADVTIGVYERELKSDFGLIEVDEEMRLLAYREKPVYRQLVSMGLYVIRAAGARDFIEAGEYLDMPQLVQSMAGAGRSVRCHRQDCLWLDIGRPEDFALAQRMMEDDPGVFLPPVEPSAV